MTPEIAGTASKGTFDDLIMEKPPTEGEVNSVTIHFVADGLTALGSVWYRGQELELFKDSEEWQQTLDPATGRSWMELTEHEQMKRYGAVHFKPGLWPYDDWTEEKAREAEIKRGRRPPIRPQGLAERPTSTTLHDAPVKTRPMGRT